jgi:hypothetical protein
MNDEDIDNKVLSIVLKDLNLNYRKPTVIDNYFITKIYQGISKLPHEAYNRPILQIAIEYVNNYQVLYKQRRTLEQYIKKLR